MPSIKRLAWAISPRPPVSVARHPTTSRFLAGCRLAGDKVVERGLNRIALDYHHFEDGLAVANFLLIRQDRALRRRLLDNHRKRRLGHRQQRMIRRRPSDML